MTSAPTLTISEFLLARIAEDERWMRGPDADWLAHCQECAFGQQPESPYTRTRLLAECDTKRLIIETHQPITGMDVCRECSHDGEVESYWVDVPCPTLRALALPYIGHSDYDERWRP